MRAPLALMLAALSLWGSAAAQSSSSGLSRALSDWFSKTTPDIQMALLFDVSGDYGPYTLTLPSGPVQMTFKRPFTSNKLFAAASSGEYSNAGIENWINYNRMIVPDLRWPAGSAPVFVGSCFQASTRGFRAIYFSKSADSRPVYRWSIKYSTFSYSGVHSVGSEHYSGSQQVYADSPPKPFSDAITCLPAISLKEYTFKDYSGNNHHYITDASGSFVTGDNPVYNVVPGIYGIVVEYSRKYWLKYENISDFVTFSRVPTQADEVVTADSPSDGSGGTDGGSGSSGPDLTEDKYSDRCGNQTGLNIFEKSILRVFQSCTDWTAKFNELKDQSYNRQPFGYYSWLNIRMGGAYDSSPTKYCPQAKILDYEIPCIDFANSDIGKMYKDMKIRSVILTVFYVLVGMALFRMVFNNGN